MRYIIAIEIHHHWPNTVSAGTRNLDGLIMLERRVIGLSDDEPDSRDIVIKITVRDVEYCFCKAKDKDAREIGVQHDWIGRTFYIDRITPKESDG